ncbi:hypothetical protein ACUNGR_06055 [Serratia sp. IR-2025]
MFEFKWLFVNYADRGVAGVDRVEMPENLANQTLQGFYYLAAVY